MRQCCKDCVFFIRGESGNVEGQKGSAESEGRMKYVQGAELLVECLIKSRKLKFKEGD